MIKENTLTNGSTLMPPPPSSLSSTKKRNRSQTTPNKTKKARLTKASDPILPSTSVLPVVKNNDEHLFRRPFLTNNNLPPVTIEQLLGLRGDIPDVHSWSINELNDFFHHQGYEYASIVLDKHHINGNKLYELKREDIFRMPTLKIGKLLKLWNVIEQIQRNNSSLSSLS
jgi:hypothetical protein